MISIGSRTRPRLVGNLATRIASVGRLPLLGEVVTNPNTAPRRGTNSAQRVAALWQQFRIPDDLELSSLEGPVLLMDDYVDTGWTLTHVSRLLRHAGAPAVLPFTLATTS